MGTIYKCDVHGVTFKSAKGAKFHASWCKASKAGAAKPKASSRKAARPRKAGKRANQASGYTEMPTASWLKAYEAERRKGANHMQACARTNRAQGTRVGFANVTVDEQGPKAGEAQPTHERSAARGVSVHSGDVKPASMPADWMLDKNGKPLMGAALERRREARERELAVAEAETITSATLPTSGHDTSERMDALERAMIALGERQAKIEDTLGNVHEMLGALMGERMGAIA